MDLMDAIAQRHSVRRYDPRPLPADKRAALDALVARANEEAGLSFAMVYDDERAFDHFLARYGSFEGVRNYLVCAGPAGPGLGEAVGYEGERFVLEAQAMGLNTCWVGGTFSRDAVRPLVADKDTLVCVIAVGDGLGEGGTHRLKPIEKLCTVEGEAPDWFERGMWAARLAPTALNQQRWHITYRGGTVEARALPGFYTDVDLGIVKRHFEIGAGKENVAWA